jgi:hypothetical protein
VKRPIHRIDPIDPGERSSSLRSRLSIALVRDTDASCTGEHSAKSREPIRFHRQSARGDSPVRGYLAEVAWGAGDGTGAGALWLRAKKSSSGLNMTVNSGSCLTCAFT